LIIVLAAVIVPELVVDTLKRRLWPSLIDKCQELEQNKNFRLSIEKGGGEGGYSVWQAPWSEVIR